MDGTKARRGLEERGQNRGDRGKMIRKVIQCGTIECGGRSEGLARIVEASVGIAERYQPVAIGRARLIRRRPRSEEARQQALHRNQPAGILARNLLQPLMQGLSPCSDPGELIALRFALLPTASQQELRRRMRRRQLVVDFPEAQGGGHHVPHLGRIRLYLFRQGRAKVASNRAGIEHLRQEPRRLGLLPFLVEAIEIQGQQLGFIV